MEGILHTFIIMVSALLLDLVLGDPVFPLHPVRLLGKLAEQTERFIRGTGIPETVGGAIALTSVLLVFPGIYGVINHLLSAFPGVQTAAAILIVYFSIALKDLTVHGLLVKKALDRSDIQEARKRTSYLVTRDTETLHEEALIRCTIESISENSCDAVIAPLFWGFLLGPAGALAYRAVNTLDAMWGYTTEKYLRFGKTAAHLDDLLSFVPARMTGILICLAAPAAGGNILRAFAVMRKDHAKTKSPNAGCSEAAMAGALGIRLAGPGTYFGTLVDKPFIGKEIVPVTKTDIVLAVRITVVSVILAVFLFLPLLLFL